MEKRALASQRGGGGRKGRGGSNGKSKTKPGSLVERTAKCPKVGDHINGFQDEIQ